MTVRLRSVALLVLPLVALAAAGQEQVDRGDAAGRATVDLSKISLRVRVARVAPEQKAVAVHWRRGGEGLGGTVTRGQFTSEAKGPLVPVGEWTAPLPLAEVAGKGGGWQFPTLVVAAEGPRGPGGKRPVAVPLTDVVVEFEFSDAGKMIKSFTEPAPRGATAGFVVPLGAADRKTFLDGLVGISEHARRRRALLEGVFATPPKTPERFGVIGHLAGYGEGAQGSGYGVRHSNPAVVADECAALRLLGVNGLVSEKSVRLADAAGAGKNFRHVYWGGPGSGSPMGFLKKRAADPDEGCPYDPVLVERMAASVKAAIEEHQRVGAKESWALWWDEIGVAAKAHLQDCPRCRGAFAAYLKAQKVTPADVGAANWDQVKPYPIWPAAGDGVNAGDKANRLAPAPQQPADALRYYYTSRFMTEATAQLFVESARQFKQAGIYLYAMQGPTPSWAGHSLDWHEFYDRGANTAFVFETSNRDPRAWQWESYLADIGRGICARHGMPMGVLVKPHRGAVAQRMLAVAARGARVIEWYTYGPDYAKGDSFSQSPELLQQVAKSAAFLGANEQYLYGAKPAVKAEVAFVSPRSSEIWGRATDLGVTAFEDAKWVYLALRHDHVPVDVLSEQQLAEGNLGQYKAIYVVGPNLRRDAGEQLRKWVEAGGTLWTDALGLSRDEANQPAHQALMGAGPRQYEAWGSVEPYRATDFKPTAEVNPPKGADVQLGISAPRIVMARTAVGRELCDAGGADVMDQFADARPAITRRLVGRGQVIHCRLWAGLTYSAKVRRADYDMSTDLDPVAGGWIAYGARMPATAPPAVVLGPKGAMPLVEAVALDKDGRRSVALMNWAYRKAEPRGGTLVPATDLKLVLRGLGEVRKARSATLGDLEVRRDADATVVFLPKLDEIDLVILEK